jgi:hypothetical protein
MHRNVTWDETSDGEIVVHLNLPMDAAAMQRYIHVDSQISS